VENSATASAVVVDKFPTGSPGAPIPGIPRGSHAYQSHQVMPEDSVWAPFRSQRDWEVARWAKMRGPTSTAMTELLAIPEVWVASYYLLCHVTEFTVIGCRLARPFFSHNQAVERHHRQRTAWAASFPMCRDGHWVRVLGILLSGCTTMYPITLW
jgi:hypothetical protein